MTQIYNRPLPYIKLNSGKSKFIREDLLYFQNGREALIYGLNLIGIKKGAKILCPAFICKSLTEFLNASGYKVIFFDVEKDLNYNTEIIKNLLIEKNIDVFLFVYYFGFLFNIKKLINICKKNKVKVIEDCSHSFLTQKNKNIFELEGDIAIYSMRKILPVSDGGALNLNKKEYKFNIKEIKAKMSFYNDILYLLERFVEIVLTKFIQVNIYSKNFDMFKFKLRNIFLKNNKKKTTNNKNREKPNLNKSILLNYFLNKEYIEFISKKRINNYEFLSSKLSTIGFKPFHIKLKFGEVPQYFLFKDPTCEITYWLRSNGISACNWPGEEIPCDVKNNPLKFKNALNLNKELVCIPIHKDLKQESYKKLIRLLKEWKKINE